jgi:uncharacterized protein (DUF2236 family)
MKMGEEPTLDGRASVVDGPGSAPDLPGLKILPRPLRRQLRQQVLAVMSRHAPAADYDTPAGDPGLFGPDSVTWKVHADFTSMMVGGLASLMLQALHPLALAGIWDHSTFRTDALGRLRNTAAFVGRTTYAPRAAAEAAIERVRVIHHHVVGTAADGRAYSADDPHLLAWVHVAECWGFLQSYQTYCRVRIPGADQDRYLKEMAVVAEALGARDVPQSRAELDGFLVKTRAELVCDGRTREVMRVLGVMRLPVPLAGISRNLFLGAAAALLPDWALDLYGRSAPQRQLDRLASGAVRLAAPSIRDAMAQGGLAWRACRRTGTDYAALFRWEGDRPV